MDRQYGARPVLTDDVKVFSHIEKLNVGGIPVFNDLEHNGFKYELTFINRTGKNLLVLTPHGGRFVSSGGTAKHKNGFCYFIQTFTLGPDISLGNATGEVLDPAAERFMQELELAIHRTRNTPSFSTAYTGQHTVLEFRYELDCRQIDMMPDGIKVDCIDYQIFRSDGNDGAKIHYGRKQYAAVHKFFDEDTLGESKATGVIAIYVPAKEEDTNPVYVMNRYFDGFLYPVIDPSRSPGVHIVQIGRRITHANEKVETYKHIPIAKFNEYNVFQISDVLETHVKDLVKGKSPKDVEELLRKLCIHNGHIDDEKPKGNAFLDYGLGDGTIGQFFTFLDTGLNLGMKFINTFRK